MDQRAGRIPDGLGLIPRRRSGDPSRRAHGDRRVRQQALAARAPAGRFPAAGLQPGLVQGNWGNQLTVLEWPMAYQYMGMALGSSAMALFLVDDLVQIVRGVPREKRYPADN
jgi:hypothetical protein